MQPATKTMIGYNRVCYKNNNTGLHNSQEMKIPFLVFSKSAYQATSADSAPTQRMREGDKRRWAGPDLSGVLPIVALISTANGAISAA
jgi:hypothetical protein